MAKLTVKTGSATRSEYVFINDASSTTGAGLTGLAFNTASLSAYYTTERGTPAAITLVTLASATTAYASGGFVAVDATNMPGLYRFDIPSAVFASTKGVVMLKGATNMVPVLLEYDVVAYDPTDTIRLGLTAIPNIAQGTTGAIATGTATGQVTVATNNDKTAYSLTQTFPTNFASMAITAGGAVTAGTVSDKTGYSLTTAPLTAGQTASAVWDALLASYTTANTFGRRLIRGTVTSPSYETFITGSNHIAADVHELQPAVITAADFAANAIDANALASTAVTEIQTGLATSIALSSVATVTTKLDSAMQLDGAVYQFTINALELAPSGGGGGSTTIVAAGPYSVIADGFGANDALDVQQSAAQSVVLRCVDVNGSGIPLSTATLSVIVYNAAGTAVVTYTGTAVYAADGWLTFDLSTAVTATAGTYTVVVRRSTSASDTSIYGPLRMYVRGI